ncbi:hypothetical protein H310_04237 [Aphanomyces invadans]|uniref:START domain-containing protein n=1 Tax=Aphanomyces invadans TaxID=157072 RepID=A0A024UG72_9STRA|nr:hypothetical protein H310_04237 [Aphanomyces invadans]ETW05279.1 hypothetical protein H310_04237 [Aphanomyces invadans]|eukprot:XP_008866717.1 hypothetical protein H310_04237 [Aphanomyces invadans]
MARDGIGDDAWPILLDLPALLAPDDQLNDDVEQLFYFVEDSAVIPEPNQVTEGPCSTAKQLQHTSSGVDSQEVQTSPLKPPRRRRCTHQERQKEELLRLRRQVVEMKQVLDARHGQHEETQDGMTLWERAARIESKERWLSVQENAQLRGAVREQAAFIEYLQHLISSQSAHHHQAEDKDAWQVYRLAANESLRTTAIHAIANRHLRRMHSAFIQLGVHGPTQNRFQARVVKPHGIQTSFRFELVNVVALPAPYSIVAAAVWQMHVGESADVASPAWPGGTTEEVEGIDSCTLYTKLRHNHDGVTSHANTIRKRYQFQGRDVIVSRSVLEDARDPHMLKGVVENKWSWLEVAAIPDNATSCRLTYVVQMDMGNTPRLMITDEEVAGLEAMLQHHHVSEDSARGPNSPLTQSTPDRPHMRGFVERGKRFVQALDSAVDHAIAQYRREPHIAT